MRSGTKPGWIFNNNGLFSEHKPRRKTTPKPWESHKNNYIVGIFIHIRARFKKGDREVRGGHKIRKGETQSLIPVADASV